MPKDQEVSNCDIFDEDNFEGCKNEKVESLYEETRSVDSLSLHNQNKQSFFSDKQIDQDEDLHKIHLEIENMRSNRIKE